MIVVRESCLPSSVSGIAYIKSGTSHKWNPRCRGSYDPINRPPWFAFIIRPLFFVESVLRTAWASSHRLSAGKCEEVKDVVLSRCAHVDTITVGTKSSAGTLLSARVKTNSPASGTSSPIK